MKSDIQKLIDWLKTYPDFKKVFDVSKSGTGQLIDFLGTETIDVIPFVRSGQKTTYRNDYILQVSRPFLTMFDRKQNAEFLAEFQKWVDGQSVADSVPRLSEYGRQRTWVDGQEYVEDITDDESALYQIPLHIEYSKVIF